MTTARLWAGTRTAQGRCGQCGNPIPERSPSAYWCGENHQREWQEQQAASGHSSVQVAAKDNPAAFSPAAYESLLLRGCLS